MAFDLAQFRADRFDERTETIKLERFGDGSETLEWKIRALNAEDLARVEEEISLNRNLSALIDMTVMAVSSGTKNDRLEAIKEILGINSKVPDVLVKQYSVFERGTIEPKFDRADTVKFAKCYPIEFKNISERIYALTGLGAVKKKLTPCGETPELKVT